MTQFNITGIIRSVDDLGRVVIPKEIRRNLGIAEGDSLDILASSEGAILLRKVVNGQPACPCHKTEEKKEDSKRVYTFTAEYDSDVKVIEITKEQEKLLLYLEKNGLLSSDWIFRKGYPNTDDLT